MSFRATMMLADNDRARPGTERPSEREKARTMRQRNFNSQALRQLAEELLSQIAEEGALTAEEREDLTTALVRQWITYAGNATLLLGEEQVYLVLGRTPLGKPCVVPEPALPGWIKQLIQDWKIDPDDLGEIIDQLNRGQSAETVNT